VYAGDRLPQSDGKIERAGAAFVMPFRNRPNRSAIVSYGFHRYVSHFALSDLSVFSADESG
jgi:hypothetical protein